MSIKHYGQTGIFFLCLFLLCLGPSISGAQNLIIKCTQTKITAGEFKPGHTASFSDWYTTHRIIYPIQQSKANLEIRMFDVPASPERGIIFTIRCFGDSLLVEKINYDTHDAKDSTFLPSKLVYRNGNEGLFRYVTRVRLTTSADSLLKAMIKHGLFYLVDKNDLLQSLKNSNTTVITPDTTYPRHPVAYKTFEIKLKDRFRSFRVDMRYVNANEGIMVFAAADKLVSAMHDIFNSLSRFQNNEPSY